MSEENVPIVGSQMNWFVREFWRKIGQISIAFQSGSVRWRHPLLFQLETMKICVENTRNTYYAMLS